MLNEAELSKLSIKKQVAYEIQRSKYNSAKVREVIGEDSLTIKEIFYKLCSEFGWSIEYVASLKVNQVSTLLKGEVDYKKRITPNSKNIQPKQGENRIDNFKDMLRSGLFKNKKKT